ncbi:hypothetical protein [Nocardia sp. NPDC057272]|uniref:hypothetical protein n=1 Tax=Nocardia sp. NPDC057272 TaxID=3346079 RepID=UPI0036273856
MVASIGLVAAFPADENNSAVPAPLTIDVKTVIGGQCDGLVFHQPINELGPPPSYGGYGVWTAERDGAETGQSKVLVSIIGKGPSPVMLTGIGAEVIDRQPGPMRGTKLNGQCGSPMKARFAEVNLDVEPPKIVGSNADPDQYYGEGTFSSTPLQFPTR